MSGVLNNQNEGHQRFEFHQRSKFVAKLLGKTSAIGSAATSTMNGQSASSGATRYVPPPAILKSLVTRQSSGNGKDTVTMSVQTFQKLLEAAVNGILDEEAYLQKHADIRAAVTTGALSSALRHYATDGYFEGRAPLKLKVDEEWYLKTYPDVALAIASGKVKNATHHFEVFGFAEGRVPNRDLQRTVAEWRDLEKKVSNR